MNIQNQSVFFLDFKDELYNEITSPLTQDLQALDLIERICKVVIYPFVCLLALVESAYTFVISKIIPEPSVIAFEEEVNFNQTCPVSTEVQHEDPAVIAITKTLDDETLVLETPAVTASDETASIESDLPTSLVPNNESCFKLGKRWACKLVPQIFPEAKIPLSLMQAGNSIKDAVIHFQEGQKVEAAKKLVPITIGGVALYLTTVPMMAAGVAAGITVYKAYSAASLVFDTLNFAREHDQQLYEDQQQEYQEALYLHNSPDVDIINF